MIKLPFFIDQQGPVQSGLIDVCTAGGDIIKGDHRDANIPFPQFRLPCTQLREVPAAGQSPQVPVKHHQQPVTRKIRQAEHPSLRVRQTERYGRLTGEIVHACFPPNSFAAAGNRGHEPGIWLNCLKMQLVVLI